MNRVIKGGHHTRKRNRIANAYTRSQHQHFILEWNHRANQVDQNQVKKAESKEAQNHAREGFLPLGFVIELAREITEYDGEQAAQ